MKHLLFLLFWSFFSFLFSPDTPTIRLKMDCDENVFDNRQDSVIVTTTNGRLDILHLNDEENCCCELEPELIIFGDTIFVYNTDVAEVSCFCLCNYKINYTINHLPYGDYTLFIGDRCFYRTMLSKRISFTPEMDTVIITRQPTPVNTTFIYWEVDTYPEFPGGENAMKTFISNRIHRTQLGKSGYAVVLATVERDGCLSDIEIDERVSLNLDKELKNQIHEIVRSMPKWSPGKIGDTIVRSKIIINIDF